MTESSGLAVASALLRLRHRDGMRRAGLGPSYGQDLAAKGAPVGSTEFGDLALGRH